MREGRAPHTRHHTGELVSSSLGTGTHSLREEGTAGHVGPHGVFTWEQREEVGAAGGRVCSMGARCRLVPKEGCLELFCRWQGGGAQEVGVQVECTWSSWQRTSPLGRGCPVRAAKLIILWGLVRLTGVKAAFAVASSLQALQAGGAGEVGGLLLRGYGAGAEGFPGQVAFKVSFE